MNAPFAGCRPSHPAWDSRRLWSLWDMLSYLFGPFYFKLRSLDANIDLVETALRSPNSFGPEFIESVKRYLVDLKDECHHFNLEQTEKHIDRILREVAIRIDYQYLLIHLKDLRDGIRDEADGHLVLHISPSRANLLYDEPNYWKAVEEAFPSTASNVASAIKCYMYDENTASVFHSMRVLEGGLKVFAGALGLPFGTEVWHVVIDQIEAEIRDLERGWPKGKSKTEFLQFYSTAAKEFRYFKDGWRNYVSHNMNYYDAPQALSALNHVRDFMVLLSSRLSEAI
jgi:hypothetical protein